jgi:hypothetical protein
MRPWRGAVDPPLPPRDGPSLVAARPRHVVALVPVTGPPSPPPRTAAGRRAFMHALGLPETENRDAFYSDPRDTPSGTVIYAQSTFRFTAAGQEHLTLPRFVSSVATAWRREHGLRCPEEPVPNRGAAATVLLTSRTVQVLTPIEPPPTADEVDRELRCLDALEAARAGAKATQQSLVGTMLGGDDDGHDNNSDAPIRDPQMPNGQEVEDDEVEQPHLPQQQQQQQHQAMFVAIFCGNSFSLFIYF